jgi:chromosome segregation ATPase
MKKICILFAALFLLSACETTGDPKQGGLFGWSQGKADQRKSERQSHLGALKQEQQSEESRKGQLSAQASGKRSERDAWKKKVQSVDTECANLKKQMDVYKAENGAQENALAGLRARQADLRQRTRTLLGGGDDVAAQEQEADRLRKEVEKLSSDFNALSLL